MTSREATNWLARGDDAPAHPPLERAKRWAWRTAFGAIGWPWLLKSLYGGPASERLRLTERLGLAPDALPNLGSWKADAGFLHFLVDRIEELRPANVVELGAGASSLVMARALERNGGGQLTSFDQHADFIEATARWLGEHGLDANLRHAPLAAEVHGWPSPWYLLSDLPDGIDLLVIDGPQWTLHPLVRGNAECLFGRLAPGALILLDDAARPGERLVARRWRKTWPNIDFRLLSPGSKGTLEGRVRS